MQSHFSHVCEFYISIFNLDSPSHTFNYKLGFFQKKYFEYNLQGFTALPKSEKSQFFIGDRKIIRIDEDYRLISLSPAHYYQTKPTFNSVILDDIFC